MTQSRRRGRPALDEHDPSVHMGLALPTKQFDGYAKRALHEDVSPAAIVRRDLRVAAVVRASGSGERQPQSDLDVFHEDLGYALGGCDLPPELAKCFDDDLRAFEFAPWRELLEASDRFSHAAASRVPRDHRVLAAAHVLRRELLEHDAFIGASLQSAAAAERAVAVEPSLSRGVAFVRGQVEVLAEATRSTLIRPMNTPELTGMLNNLIAWGEATLDESRRFEQRRRRGRVSNHRRTWLAHQTMRHLERIGVPLSCANHGTLANVLRVVLAAADRREHKSPARRTDLRDDLRRWRSTYRPVPGSKSETYG